ncbi:MAG TPA: formylglycine-generating enzyme family protein [Candidatus Hydrogenedentes bacterium]|nr:formylglycine-generating enzyme family protein [Candidatus Hydrogenedentota bacterium]HPG65401.1 formylglycine-generating enzyme family protein [Candidatus Hydrogenedentota bacterium]
MRVLLQGCCRLIVAEAGLALLLAGCPKPGDDFIGTFSLPGDVALRMVRIECGTFTMGSPAGELQRGDDEAQLQVTLTHDYSIGKYEVTKAQWEAVMHSKPWEGQDEVNDAADSPAEYISWNQAQAFISALNAATGKTFRLPTEAEWEYACRAGTTTMQYWGDDPEFADLDEHAWWFGNTSAVGQDGVHACGEKKPNAWGLYDMIGNVWEWCTDWYGPYPDEAVKNPGGPEEGTFRVVRGGNWECGAGPYLRSADRESDRPNSVVFRTGFRVAR